MKSLIRYLTTVGLISTTIFSSWFIQTDKLLALPVEVILDKLKPVPVFAVADDQGAPLIASGEKNTKIAGVFISQQDAIAFIAKLKQENPDLGKKVQVLPLSLAEVFELNEANKNKPDGINFAFVPNVSQIDAAKKILTEKKQEYKGGVPLFFGTTDKDGYLTVKINNNEVIPFFFEESQAQNLINTFKKDQPSLASTISVQVVPLEGVLSAMKEGDDDILKKIIFWPSAESLAFLRSLNQNKPNQTIPPAQTNPPSPQK